MRREDLEHLLRAAGAVLGDDEIIVIGSQSVLGSIPERLLPEDALLSMEADLLPLHDPDAKKADLLDGALGEDSMFHETHGYYAQGVDEHTAVLPSGWRERLTALSNANTRGVIGWCLDPHDLAVSKLVAGRTKDHEFIGALLRAGLLDLATLKGRLADPALTESQRRAAERSLSSVLRRGRD